jgi:hypothetical protein
MPKNEKWTSQDDRRLLALKAAGKAHAVIGHVLGRSTGSINGRLAILHTKTARLRRAAALGDRSVPLDDAMRKAEGP